MDKGTAGDQQRAAAFRRISGLTGVPPAQRRKFKGTLDNEQIQEIADEQQCPDDELRLMLDEFPDD